MKIAYIITRSDVIGGASAHLLDLVFGVKNRGFDVKIFVGGKGIVFQKAVNMGIPCRSVEYLVRKISPINDVRAFFELVKALREYSPNVVHVHSAKAGILGRLASHHLSVPVIYTAHGWPFTDGVSTPARFLYKNIERFMARYTSKIITVSDHDNYIALEKKVAEQKKLITIHNGIPDTSRKNRFKSLNEENKSSPVKLIMVARFERQKDQRSLIEALEPLKRYEWELDFIGDGPLKESAITLCRKCGLENKIKFLGSRDDVPIRLESADILLLISRWEGLPITIVEAMRASLPVIASNVGGVREQIEHGRTGFLISRGAVTELTKVIQTLLDNPILRQEMGVKARIRYEKEFYFEKMLNNTLDVYRDVVKG